MSRKRGFTLVELLVVIGIIAILIGILIPTLSKAREASQRTACLSNLREVMNAFRLYAAAFKDACPIGYVNNAKQFSYMMNYNGTATPHSVTEMGFIAIAGLAKNGRAYYCPSEQDILFMYDAYQNYWVFDRVPQHPQLISQTGPNQGYNNAHTRMGYNARPVANFQRTAARPQGLLLPQITYSPDYRSSGATAVFGFLRLAQLKNKAILSDLVNYGPQSVRVRHKKGINVLYANGSAKWVELKAFERREDTSQYAWHKIPSGIGEDINSTRSEYNNAMLDEVNNPPRGVWIDLDKQSR
jgi:prepilin-type N-terminal cleavage/methylation domain-containing protein